MSSEKLSNMRSSFKFVISRGRQRLPLLFVVTFLFLTYHGVSAQRRERIVENWRPLHYDVTISLNDQVSEVTNARTEINVVVTKNAVNTIDLDFGDMSVDSVTVSGEPARFERKPELLHVVLPHAARAGERFTIAVTYHGKPKDGLIFGNDRDGKPSATGDNWPNRVHHWIPSLDHPSAKATVSFTISAPPRDIVVANGKFVTMTSNGAAPAVWRFEETKPIPPYCIIIAVNEGVKLDATEPTVTPLSYYVSQKDRAYAPKGFSTAGQALAFFSETIGPYPYEKLALIVGSTRFGGMENSSAIVFTSTLFDPRGNDKISTRFGIPTRIENLVAHEIAHQWFGDSVTQSKWADLWLSEGFATYFAGLFIEKYEGEDAFREYMRGAAERYFAYEKRRNAPIHDTETTDLMRLLNPNNYEKGAWVLHMLRAQLGDEAFLRGLRAYYAAYREANATTEDLRRTMEKASGVRLREFFSRWIYGSGHPKYGVTWTWKGGAGKGTLMLRIEQTQESAPFLMPVPLDIVSAKGTTKRTIKPSGKLTVVRFPLNARPTDLRLDPDQTLLKEAVIQRGQ